MLKKTITYTDYNGVERTEDFYFNLSKAEVIEMETSVDGGYGEWLQKIVEEKRGSRIMEAFKKLILKSYGEKSLDGRTFVKSEEMSTNFSQTEAYSELFMELCTDSDAAAAFVNAVLPKMDGGNNSVVPNTNK